MAGRFREENFEDQQTCAYDDGAVGHVECGPLIAADVEEQKIHYVAAHDAIPEIADCSSQN